MSLEITGKIAVKYDTQVVNDRFKKREFVLELSEEINGNVYTNWAKMQLVQNKCEILDRFNEGDQVRVNFNIKGNRWEKDGQVNYFTNLDVWRIESASNGGGQQYQQPAQQYQQPAQQESQSSAPNANSGGFYTPAPESADDLPF